MVTRQVSNILQRPTTWLLLSVFLAWTLLRSSASKPLRCLTNDLQPFLPPGATILFAIPNGANSTFGNASDILYPGNATNLPAFCAVQVNVTSSPHSSFTFGLFLPVEWNGRFLAVGNGGFGGGINWPDMGAGLKYGFAAMSTDTGHNSTWDDGTWALNQPEKVQDWGHRAMHGSVAVAKTLVNAYYKEAIKYSYYSGCSTGGRQGLREIQLHPDSFDGVLAGAPAWWTARLQTWTVQAGKSNLPATKPGHIPLSLFPVFTAEVMRQCDSVDGLVDGIISDPSQCDFSYEALLCKDESATDCLTEDQIQTLKSFHEDYFMSDAFIFPGLELGSEPQWAGLFGNPTAPHSIGVDYIKYFLLNDPAWSWQKFDYSIIQLADQLDPGNASATDFDLSQFQARGGKLIQYHGLSDGLIPTRFSVYFYNQVLRLMSAKGIPLDPWYRLFLIPGMLHCSFCVNNAPWYIAGANQASDMDAVGGAHSVPGFMDSRHDALKALMAWVEEGKAPEELVATKFVDDSFELGIHSQRPVCPFPSQAQYVGGNVNKPRSFQCVKRV